MKTFRAIWLPLVALLVFEAIGAASLAWSASLLPPKVASHFGAQGEPNGWTTRAAYLQGMAAFSLLLPLFLLAVGLLTAVLPIETMNLPRRDYWLAPERRDETSRYIANKFAWLACAVLGLSVALHWLIVAANRSSTGRLSNVIWLFLLVFLAFVIGWLVVIVRHFKHPRTAAD